MVSIVPNDKNISYATEMVIKRRNKNICIQLLIKCLFPIALKHIPLSLVCDIILWNI